MKMISVLTYVINLIYRLFDNLYNLTKRWIHKMKNDRPPPHLSTFRFKFYIGVKITIICITRINSV